MNIVVQVGEKMERRCRKNIKCVEETQEITRRLVRPPATSNQNRFASTHFVSGADFAMLELILQ
jgi:hypothetical protein